MKGFLTITTNPSGAKIFVDGILMKDANGNPVLTPAKLELFSGQRYISLEMDEHYKDQSYVYIYHNSDIKLDRSLSRLPYSISQIPYYKPETPAIPTYKPATQTMQGPTTGTVVITSYPAGATIDMDGKTVIDISTKEPVKTPVQLEVPIGLHNFVFKLPGYCIESGGEYVTPNFTVYIHRDFNAC